MLHKVLTSICCASLLICLGPEGAIAKNSDDRPGFFQRHKRLKKILLIGGVGAATGGVGAAVMGNSIAGGAATGAGTKLGLHAAKEKYKEHKNRRR